MSLLSAAEFAAIYRHWKNYLNDSPMAEYGIVHIEKFETT